MSIHIAMSLDDWRGDCDVGTIYATENTGVAVLFFESNFDAVPFSLWRPLNTGCFKRFVFPWSEG